MHNICTRFMIAHMRTTVSIDDELGRTARAQARARGISMRALVARALGDFLLKPPRPEMVPRFRLVTVAGGGPRSGIDLDRISALLVAEDEAAYGGVEDGR